MYLLTTFWNSTIAGGIYGFIASLIIFLLTYILGEKARKKDYQRDLFRAFIDSNPKLINLLESANQSNIDLNTYREVFEQLNFIYLKDEKIQQKLSDLKRISILQGEEFRKEKGKVESLLKELHQLLNEKRNVLM